MKNTLKSQLFAILFLFSATLFPLTSIADNHTDLKFSGYVATAPKMAKVFAAYINIQNSTPQNYRLVGAASDQFEKVELHLTTKEGGMMKMVEQDFFTLDAYSEFEMKPGSFHLMLIENLVPIELGDEVNLNLSFDDGSAIFTRQVSVKVQPRTQMMSH